jgi:membrane protein
VSPASSLRTLARDAVDSARGHDLALYAAGVTFYAAVGAVPLLLLTLHLGGLAIGPEHVRGLATRVAQLLPAGVGARGTAQWLIDAGTRMSPVSAALALLPAGLYGEGLVRAFDRLSRGGDRGRRTLRGRLGTLVVVAVGPVLLLAGLSAGHGLTSALGDRPWERVLGVYAAFLVLWLVISVLLLCCYRGFAAETIRWRALLWGSFGTGSFVSGTSLGWVLYLSLDLPLGGVYGGSTGLATAAVTGLWLYVLHVLVLAGWCVTLHLAARAGRPLGEVVSRTPVRPAA